MKLNSKCLGLWVLVALGPLLAATASYAEPYTPACGPNYSGISTQGSIPGETLRGTSLNAFPAGESLIFKSSQLQVRVTIGNQVQNFHVLESMASGTSGTQNAMSYRCVDVTSTTPVFEITQRAPYSLTFNSDGSASGGAYDSRLSYVAGTGLSASATPATGISLAQMSSGASGSWLYQIAADQYEWITYRNVNVAGGVRLESWQSTILNHTHQPALQGCGAGYQGVKLDNTDAGVTAAAFAVVPTGHLLRYQKAQYQFALSKGQDVRNFHFAETLNGSVGGGQPQGHQYCADLQSDTPDFASRASSPFNIERAADASLLTQGRSSTASFGAMSSGQLQVGWSMDPHSTSTTVDDILHGWTDYRFYRLANGHYELHTHRRSPLAGSWTLEEWKSVDYTLESEGN